MITAHTLPRAYDLVETDDPLIWRCFYCGVDLNYKYGKYAWNIDTINRPWKIQCPDCKRLFPSNDFASFYKLGLDPETGLFNRELALEKHLREKLSDLPLHVVQAQDPRHWSGIVCIYYPPNRDDEVIAILRRHRIHATMRGGYIRLGIGLYNTVEQMDIVADALHEVAALIA